MKTLEKMKKKKNENSFDSNVFDFKFGWSLKLHTPKCTLQCNQNIEANHFHYAVNHFYCGYLNLSCQFCNCRLVIYRKRVWNLLLHSNRMDFRRSFSKRSFPSDCAVSHTPLDTLCLKINHKKIIFNSNNNNNPVSIFYLDSTLHYMQPMSHI